jgi:ubiquinone/menaquinone biosynthesis C-methylase UbiE
MMDLPTELCVALSRRLMQAPARRVVDYGAYSEWRNESLERSWSAFADECVVDRDVLDFGCGDGQLSLYLAKTRRVRSITGVDVNPDAIARAERTVALDAVTYANRVQFLVGSVEGLPVPSESMDTLLAFDCLEHVMSPGPMLHEWYRVLRPGGRCLIEWFPYRGPWGAHMESLIPIPWAHVLFGERAMFRAAERIYDLDGFVPRHWDLEENGQKKPNKWRAWSSFDEQGFINKLDLATFRRLAQEAGFQIARFERRGFGGSIVRRTVSRMLMNLPFVSEYFVSYVIVELLRPAAGASAGSPSEDRPPSSRLAETGKRHGPGSL